MFKISANVVVQLANTTEVAELNNKLDRILANEEKIIMGLETEFAAFNDALTRQLDEINRQIQQVADAVAAGSDATATVEDARAKITAATAAIAASADTLAADNPPTP